MSFLTIHQKFAGVLVLLFAFRVPAAQGQTLRGGVPLGGIGTGTVRLRPDGSFGQSTITNNRAYPLREMPGCFAAVWTKNAAGTQSAVLSLSNRYALPAVSALQYEGLFPQAKITYRLAAPISLSMTAFSPLIPFDLRNSTQPAAAFVFHIKNQTDQPAEISLAFSWENFLGVGGTKHTGAFADRTGNAIQNLPDSEGIFGVRLTSPTASNRSAAQRFRDNADGEMALVCLPSRSQAQVTSSGWNTLDSSPAWWNGFAAEGIVGASASPVGEEGRVHPAGVIAVKLTLRAKESLDVPFAVAWNTPHFASEAGIDYGRYYQTTNLGAAATAQRLLRDWRALHALTEDWQNRILISTLPRPAAIRVIDALAPLIANTLYTRDGRLVFFSEAEGYSGNSASLTDIDALFPALLAFFPRLAAQHLRQFAALSAPSGLLPDSLGDPETTLNVPGETVTLPQRLNNTEPPHSTETLRANAVFLAEMALFVQQTGDREFLKALYPVVTRCAEALQKEPRLYEDVIVRGFRAMAWMAETMGEKETAAHSQNDAEGNTPTKKIFLPVRVRSLDFPAVDRLLSEEPLALNSADDFNIINELSGLKWDAINGNLTLASEIPGTWRNLSVPIFLPSVWGKLDYKPTAHGGTTTLRIDRLIPLPPSLSEKPAAGRAELLVKQWTVPGNGRTRPEKDSLSVGLGQNALGYQLIPAPMGLLSLMFDMAVRLNAGDRLEAVVR